METSLEFMVYLSQNYKKVLALAEKKFRTTEKYADMAVIVAGVELGINLNVEHVSYLADMVIRRSGK